MRIAPTNDPQLVLVRHGETEWSRTGQHTGRTDIELTSDGEDQARAAGRALTDFEFAAVFSSPLHRARRTAELLGYRDAIVDANLAEWDYGPVEGRTAEEIGVILGHEYLIFTDGVRNLAGWEPAASDPGADDADDIPNPGELLSDVYARALAFLDRVEPILAAGGDVLAVAHGHLLRILATAWLGADPRLGAHLELGTAAVCILGYGHHLRTIEAWNLPPQA
jgi:broad specificity phosphatase PhoE